MTFDHAAPKSPGDPPGNTLPAITPGREKEAILMVSDYKLAEIPVELPELCRVMKTLAWIDKPIFRSVSIHDYREALQRELAREMEKTDGDILTARQNHLALVLDRTSKTRKLALVALGTSVTFILGYVGLSI